MAVPSKQASHGKRTRSFGGCATCRGRRLKCDEVRPICTKCRSDGAVCGYENSLFFDSDDAVPGEQPSRYRRPLLSLEQMASMSAQIASSVPPKLVLWQTSRIDSQCESIPVAKEVNVHRGPFGAFRIKTTGHVDAADSPSRLEVTHDTESNVLETIDEELPLVGETLMSPDTQAPLNPLIGNSTYDLDLDLDLALWDTAADFDDFHDANIDSSYFERDQIPFMASEDQMDVQAISNRPSNQFTISRSISPVACAQIDIFQSALVLLNHYRNNVLKAMTPFYHSKTPWHILFFPLVKNCIAGLALRDDVDRATLCVFYGTLAISASSLSNTSQSGDWARESDVYRERAYEHAKASLKTAYDGFKKAKYKTQLMALLTMAQISIVRGQQDQTEYYLLETEKLIRMRGLNRSKSRKVRLLHHCYAYERIFFESTVVRDAKSSQYQLDVRRAIEASGAGAYSKDSLSFRLSRWENLETDVLKLKDQESGENDLHLQIPGAWPNTLYPEIFGVPEVHLLSVSLIIRLARERDAEDAEDASSNLDLKTFISRAKATENLISHRRPPTPTPNTGLAHLIEATHHAIVIYFYRKIFDVDSSVLQQRVSNVRECLFRYECVTPEKGFASMRLIWPACVAACEAEGCALQTYFLKWFESAAQRSGLPLFTVTLSRIKDIWQERLSPATPVLDAF